MNLISEAELAVSFGIDTDRAADLRRQHKWPHVRLGRFDIRYTHDQVAEIVAMQTVTPKPTIDVGLKIAGQTARSAGRKKQS